MGNTTGGMINVTVLRSGPAMRYVPVAAGGAIHVPLAIVDELQSGTEITIAAAAEGWGKLILDVGFLEVNTS
ncbi:MAG TPA: hypothetical protein VF558_11860 [Rubrobacteraceae bacterium]